MAEAACAAVGLGQRVHEVKTVDVGDMVECHLGDAYAGFNDEGRIGFMVEDYDATLATIVGVYLTDEDVGVEALCGTKTGCKKRDTLDAFGGEAGAGLYFGLDAAGQLQSEAEGDDLTALCDLDIAGNGEVEANGSVGFADWKQGIITQFFDFDLH